MTEPNPLEVRKKEIGELKRIIHSLATVPREIAFMVTPQRYNVKINQIIYFLM